MEHALSTVRSIAVLGIKPESRRQLDAHQIPLYLQSVGYEIIPVPLRYPEASHILGVRVHRRLTEVRSPIDVLNVFCKLGDFTPHVSDVLVVRPRIVWFQSGLLDRSAARTLVDAGIAIAEDCIGCRRATIEPAAAPLEVQQRDRKREP